MKKEVIIIVTSIIFIFIIYWVSTSLATEGNMTGNCLEEPGPEKSGGWTWFGITMGVSTHSDMIDSLGDPEKETAVFHKGRDQLGCFYVYKIEESVLYILVIDSRVETLEFVSPDYPLGINNTKLSDLINFFGKPDLVGYNMTYGSGYRTVVWLDKGVQANIKLNDFPYEPDQILVTSIKYFYPMEEELYFHSYISVAYSEKQPKTDVIDLAPMNPFKWED